MIESLLQPVIDDIATLKGEIKADLATLEGEIKGEIKEIKADVDSLNKKFNEAEPLFQKALINKFEYLTQT